MRLGARCCTHGTKAGWQELRGNQVKDQRIDKLLQNQATQSRKGEGTTQE